MNQFKENWGFLNYKLIKVYGFFMVFDFILIDFEGKLFVRSILVLLFVFKIENKLLIIFLFE